MIMADSASNCKEDTKSKHHDDDAVSSSYAPSIESTQPMAPLDSLKIPTSASLPTTTNTTIAASPATAETQKKKHKKRKASNGRLKKLWRRAVSPSSSPQGITSRSEWLEMVELHTEWKKLHPTTTISEDGNAGGKQTKENSSSTDRDSMMGPLPGPFVNLSSTQQKSKLRDFTNVDQWQITEGSDHRDVLLNLLFAKQSFATSTAAATTENGGKKKKKKRKLDSNSNNEAGSGNNGGSGALSSSPSQQQKLSSLANLPPLPSWANIGNLAGVGGVAVIEINIHDPHPRNNNNSQEEQGIGISCPIMPSQRIKNALLETTTDNNIWTSLLSTTHDDTTNTTQPIRRTIGAACKVKLFQGEKYPRCLSEVIMFLPPSNPSSTGTAPASCNDAIKLVKEVQSLKLTVKQMRSEGFPMEVRGGGDKSNKARNERLVAMEKISKLSNNLDLDYAKTSAVSAMSIPSVEEALELARVLAVNVEYRDGSDMFNNRYNENEDAFRSMEHYVKTFSRDLLANNIDNHSDGGSSSDDNDQQKSDRAHPTRKPKIFALDCEMVKTSEGPELARVSLIAFADGTSGDSMNEGGGENEKSVVVLDELVKPRRTVLDYLTGM